jgi:hypothetical protein
MAAFESAPLDRVAERKRAVLLARHYREAEGLTIIQIAQRLGRSRATVKAYFYDPSDANKGPSWEREAEPGGRELRSHPPAAASRGDVLPRRTLFCARLAVQHCR